MIPSTSMLLFTASYWCFVLAPFALLARTRKLRVLRPSRPPLTGFSVDYVILVFQASVYRALYSVLYLFPSDRTKRLHAARYPTRPQIDKHAVFVDDLVPSLSAWLFIFLLFYSSRPPTSGFSIRAAAPHFFEQLELRFSTFAKYYSGLVFFLILVVAFLSTSVDVDPRSSMAFWGLFPIDSIDLLKGMSQLLIFSCEVPQIIVNFDNFNSLALDINYVHLRFLFSVLYFSAYVVDATNLPKNATAEVAFRPGGSIIIIFSSWAICVLFYVQILFYRSANDRAWRAIYKRASEDISTSREPDNEESIALMQMG
ncbi:uncharacterized protein V1516DRAFT_675143 [Lipomyces oligophaga]|uniref:uncharacterized protein n=1 Tax=Lipomyces oligophaga TaxID=45792 RepID=UPI0034CF60E5